MFMYKRVYKFINFSKFKNDGVWLIVLDLKI